MTTNEAEPQRRVRPGQRDLTGRAGVVSAFVSAHPELPCAPKPRSCLRPSKHVRAKTPFVLSLSKHACAQTPFVLSPSKHACAQTPFVLSLSKHERAGA